MTTAETTDAVAPTPGPVPGNGAAPDPAAVAAAQSLIEAAANEPAALKAATQGKVYASFIEMREKEKRTDDVLINMRIKGEWVERYVQIEAIGATEYDELLARHKPTAKQQADGQTFNIDTFLPALIAACAVNPKLTAEQVKELHKSETWSGGEIGGLFFRCQRVCQANPDVPFTEAD